MSFHSTDSTMRVGDAGSNAGCFPFFGRTSWALGVEAFNSHGRQKRELSDSSLELSYHHTTPVEMAVAHIVGIAPHCVGIEPFTSNHEDLPEQSSLGRTLWSKRRGIRG
jgi:hypothetical protein